MKTLTKVAIAGTVAVLIAGGGVAAAQAQMGWHHGPRIINGMGQEDGGPMEQFRMRHMMREMLARFDTNKDGALTQDEINQARATLFNTYDTQKSGSLTLDQFQNLWLSVNRERMVRAFQALDRDGDGKITLEEYESPLANIVADHDMNGDGKLSTDDRPAYRQMDGGYWFHHRDRMHGGADNGDNGDNG
jgi:Ca2+-binding EF-hand superfamily protein